MSDTPAPGFVPLFQSREPYYADEWATIYHADCRSILPHITADVILTDLPYGIGVAYDGYEDTGDSLDALIADTLPMMTAAAPVVALTCGIDNLSRFPSPRWVLCWYQTNATGSTECGLPAPRHTMTCNHDGYWGANA